MDGGSVGKGKLLPEFRQLLHHALLEAHHGHGEIHGNVSWRQGRQAENQTKKETDGLKKA
jgi:hypothetical protein